MLGRIQEEAARAEELPGNADDGEVGVCSLHKAAAAEAAAVGNGDVDGNGVDSAGAGEVHSHRGFENAVVVDDGSGGGDVDDDERDDDDDDDDVASVDTPHSQRVVALGDNCGRCGPRRHICSNYGSAIHQAVAASAGNLQCRCSLHHFAVEAVGILTFFTIRFSSKRFQT